MADVILEVVEAPRARAWPPIRTVPPGSGASPSSSRTWEATALTLGPLLGSPRAAVQPGRRIATLSGEAGLGAAIAFMT